MDWNSLLIGAAGGLTVKVWDGFVKNIPQILINKVDKTLTKLFEEGDEIDDRFLSDVALAYVRWAEVKFPGKGRGAEKMAAVSSNFILNVIKPRLPIWIRPFIRCNNIKVQEFIESIVTRLNSYLKEKVSTVTTENTSKA